MTHSCSNASGQTWPKNFATLRLGSSDCVSRGMVLSVSHAAPDTASSLPQTVAAVEEMPSPTSKRHRAPYCLQGVGWWLRKSRRKNDVLMALDTAATPMDLGPDWGPTVIIIALVGITSHHWKSSKGLPYNPLVVLDKPDLSLKRILKERKTRGGVKEFWTSQSRLNP
ncbi:hypothetical protein B0H14DRAFT_2579891 [Mycena olivaceomarginata]|nr:hypothetical protein B0H14DRAFT_2579891 [Mycena olivaceomarginata]